MRRIYFFNLLNPDDTNPVVQHSHEGFEVHLAHAPDPLLLVPGSVGSPFCLTVDSASAALTHLEDLLTSRVVDGYQVVKAQRKHFQLEKQK